MDFQEGVVLAFDKPYRWTSFDVVGKVRWLLCRHLGIKKLKVGHAGTLDPLATGVLIVCTGRATKRIEELQSGTKEYLATIRLGATTPSYDQEKPIDATYPTEHITRDMVQEVLERFKGTIEQVPPTFSACKVDGKRAYKMARNGDEVELKPKTLTIDEIELTDCSLPDITVRERRSIWCLRMMDLFSQVIMLHLAEMKSICQSVCPAETSMVRIPHRSLPGTIMLTLHMA